MEPRIAAHDDGVHRPFIRVDAVEDARLRVAREPELVDEERRQRAHISGPEDR